MNYNELFRSLRDYHIIPLQRLRHDTTSFNEYLDCSDSVVSPWMKPDIEAGRKQRHATSPLSRYED